MTHIPDEWLSTTEPGLQADSRPPQAGGSRDAERRELRFESDLAPLPLRGSGFEGSGVSTAPFSSPAPLSPLPSREGGTLRFGFGGPNMGGILVALGEFLTSRFKYWRQADDG